MNEFFQRLKQRKLVQWAIAYVAAAFALLQGIDIVAQQFGWPEGVRRGITLGLIIGFFVTLILAWYHGERGAQRVTGTELLIIGLVLALGGGFLWRFAAARSADSKTATVPNESSSVVNAKSIAVLPFVNISADKNDEYLSDGMTEELINVLSKVPGLRVPGRTSCFAFKGKNEENIFRKVGAQLQVGTVLEGSVRKAGDKLRVTAQLINVSDGYHLWSKDYDGDAKDILNFQSNVAEQVVQALQMKLGGDEKRALAKKPTENPEAHRLYLLGRYHIDKFTEADVAAAVHYFEQALQLDPGFALAYSGLADTYWAKRGNAMPSREAWAKQKALAEKALELDPELAQAHLSLASALTGAF
ncbi:MAG TPA: hypothetical protein VN825_10595, partial [Candidatus Acidoferrum sp.]|nr:hypothetical protein [Candidatus Acidoferrum sp.]